MSTESLMPSNHLIVCHTLLLLPSIFPSIRVLFSELTRHIRWPKYWSFSFSISPFKEYSGLISFRIDWFDLPCYFWKPLLNTITFVSQFKHVCKFKLRPSSSFFVVVVVVIFFWVYMSSPSRYPLPPPSPPAPSRSSQSTRSERLSHASNLGWWSVSPLIVYMFWCCSLETSHPRLLPQSLNDCSINLCLFFCSAYRVIINIFLNSIYMC